MPELHPAGTFNDVEILDHGFGESSQAGTLFLWVIAETPQSEQFGTINGRFYLKEPEAKVTIQTMKKIKAMGFTGKSIEELADGTALAGNLCQITVEHDSYEGTIRAQIGFINENNSKPAMTHDEEAALKTNMYDAVWQQEFNPADTEEAPF